MSSYYRIGIVSCRPEKMADYYPTITDGLDFVPTELPFTPDDQFLIDAMRRRGMIVEPIIWGTDPADLAQYNMLLFRAPWDYMDSEASRRAFVIWLEELQAFKGAVENPLPFMQWLIDKRYLLDMQEQDIPIVPTEYIKKDGSADLPLLFDAHGPLIIKPAFSAAGVGLVFLRTRDDAVQFQATFNGLVQKESHLVQTFLPEIQTEGEWSLVFFDGVYSHAVLKKPAPDSILVHAERGGSLHFGEPPAHVIEAAQRAMDAVSHAYSAATGNESVTPLYLRMDMIITKDGVLVSEVEGIDSELLFRALPGSEEKCCDALVSRLSQRSSSVKL